MAIKGKKKSRGSQAKRRPASAPRPVAVPRRGPSWYQTRDGKLVIAIFSLVLLGTIIWAIASARSNAAEADERRDALEDYTGQIRSILGEIAQPVQQMNAAALAGASGDVSSFESRATDWAEALSAAQAQTTSLSSDLRELDSVGRLIGQSIVLYRTGASTFELAAEADEGDREQLIAQAGGLVSSGASVFDAAVEVLDTYRVDVDMDRSGLSSPTVDPSAVPSPGASVITPEDSGVGGNQQGSGGKGSKKKSGGGGD